MPHCGFCGSELKCACGQAAVGTVSQPCALKKGAVWVHVVNDLLADIPGVDIGCGGVDKPTDGSGLARFDPLDENTYRVEMRDLSPALAATYAPPRVLAHDTVKAINAQIAYVAFELARKSAPVIELPGGDVVIVRRAYHGQPQPGVPPHRIPVKLSAAPAHDGTGEFTCPAGMQAFDTKDGSVPLASPVPLSTGDLKGRTLFLEASQPSAAYQGTELKLELQGGTIPPRAAEIKKITCVRLTVDCYEPGAANPLADGPKIQPGRAVGAGGKRAKVILKQAEPADFPGKILLRKLSAKVTGFGAEKPVGGEAALADDAVGKANSALGAGETVWTAAAGVSDAVADTGWFAAVEGIEDTGRLVEGDRVAMTAIELEVEMFRGAFAAGTPLTIAPFYCVDDAASLDAALPVAQHNQPAASRPGALDAAFAAPLITDYSDHAAANADLKVFRFRVKVKPSLDAFAGPNLDLTVKVQTAAGEAPTVETSMAYKAPAGAASHSAGMPLKLEKKAVERLFLSPYCRVLTIAQQGRSKQPNYAIIHSLPPLSGRVIDKGKQFGRRLVVESEAYGLSKTYTLGGQPYAEIPVQFYYVNTAPPEAKYTDAAYNKIHQLNQYWAGAGLQFRFADPAQPLIHKQPPQSNLITIGDEHGATPVAAADFFLNVTVRVTPAGGAGGEVQLEVAGAANWTPLELGNEIAAAARGVSLTSGRLAGLRLDAKVHDLAQPRRSMAFDLNLCRDDAGTGHDMTNLPRRELLPKVGTVGPVDVEIVAHASSTLALGTLEVTDVSVSPRGGGVAPVLDLKAPKMDHPDHGVARNPPDAVARHWVRAFAPSAGAFVSVLAEGPNCYPSDSGSRTLLNPGIWNEPGARLICYMRDLAFIAGADDVQHEMAHVLTWHNHTLFHPKWFYNAELLRNGSGEPANKTTRMTSQQIFVDGLEFHGGEWYATYVSLPQGYGGASRAGTAQLNATWLTGALDAGQDPW